MSKKKHKNRKAIEQRRMKAAQKREQHRKKAKACQRAREHERRSFPPDMIMSRPPLAGIEAPEGFRPIGMAQAMMEYIRPLRDYIEEETVEDSNKIMQIGMGIWNHAIALEENIGRGPLRDELIRQMQQELGLAPQEAVELFERMVERKEYLLPADIQPPYPTVMFIRKEISYLIADFNYESLDLSPDPLPADEEDRQLVEALHRLDRYMEEGIDYGEWEQYFFSTKENCGERFYQWLRQKGAAEYAEDFPGCADIYLDFVYGYMHPEVVTLGNVSAPYIEEFFAYYLLRKVTAEPHEYTHWPPALKLFYGFLREKGYLPHPEPVVELVDEFEPHFIALLRERYA
jgi:hypothetical protein